MNDPELKAMSTVYDALLGLDADTRKRVTDWVLAKLKNTSGASGTGAKRGPKPGAKKAKGAKRGRKPAAAKASATPVKKAGKRGRPAGSAKKQAKPKAAKSTGASRRGRPRKSAGAAVNA